jgi:hypothetical protein
MALCSAVWRCFALFRAVWTCVFRLIGTLKKAADRPSVAAAGGYGFRT